MVCDYFDLLLCLSYSSLQVPRSPFANVVVVKIVCAGYVIVIPWVVRLYVEIIHEL